MTTTAEPVAEGEEPEVPVWEWRSVESWSPELHRNIEDLKFVTDLLAMMRGAGAEGDKTFIAGRDFLDRAQRNLRSEIARQVLGEHGMTGMLEQEEPDGSARDRERPAAGSV